MNAIRSIWWRVQDWTRDRAQDVRDFCEIVGPTGWFLVLWTAFVAFGFWAGIRLVQEVERGAVQTIQRTP